jgi:hypothetical protein
MAYKLSTRSFLKRFRDIPDMGISEPKEKPDTEEEALLHDFVRVLKAQRPSDISDISDSRIIDILAHLGELSGQIQLDNPFFNGSVLGVLRSKRSVRRKRRIL